MTAEEGKRLHARCGAAAGPGSPAVFIEHGRRGRYYPLMTILRVLLALAVLLLAACSSSAAHASGHGPLLPGGGEQAQRDIDRLAQRRNRGEISAEEYKRRAAAITDSIPRRASDDGMGQARTCPIRTPRHGHPDSRAPVQLARRAAERGSGSFYRQAGQTGAGYQGASPGSSGRLLSRDRSTPADRDLRN